MHRLIASTAVALLTALSLPASAQTGGVSVATAPGKGAIAETVKLEATITAIDKATRAVTLKNDKGEEMTVTAGPEVKNFNQMKVGDVVSVEYLRALALELKKGGGLIVQRTEQAGGAAAKPGEKPAGAVGRQVKVVADVIGLDPGTQTVTLKGPQRTVELKIADPEQFKRIAKGDQVEATFTEAVAIAVTPAKKAAAPAAKKEEKRKPKGGC
jgi:Cu/Ag efflux protein CusF